MTLGWLWRAFIQGVRYLALPFPFAAMLCMILLRIAHPDMDFVGDGEPADGIGNFLAIYMLIVLQAFIGIPSILILHFSRSRLPRFLLVGFFFSVVLSAVLCGPVDGEELTSFYFRALAHLLPTIALAYLLAYCLRGPEKSEAEQGTGERPLSAA